MGAPYPYRHQAQRREKMLNENIVFEDEKDLDRKGIPELSEEEREEQIKEQWRGVKRRAYTYHEKKLNRLSDYDLYVELYGKTLDEEKMREHLDGGKYISARKLKRVKKAVEEKWNRESYDEEMEAEEGLFAFMVGVRDEVPCGFSNAEAYAITIHTIDRVLSDIGKIPRAERDPDALSKMGADIINDMTKDWKYYMDTVPDAERRIGKVTDAYAKTHTDPGIKDT